MPEKSGFFGSCNCWLTDFQPQMVIVALRAWVELKKD